MLEPRHQRRRQPDSGRQHQRNDPVKASFLPVGLHLALVLVAGIWLPPALVAWFQHVASLLN